jgi:hypothetical protein
MHSGSNTESRGADHTGPGAWRRFVRRWGKSALDFLSLIFVAYFANYVINTTVAAVAWVRVLLTTGQAAAVSWWGVAVGLLFFAGHLVLAFVVFLWGKRRARELFVPGTRDMENDLHPPRRKVLIVFLSWLKHEKHLGPAQLSYPSDADQAAADGSTAFAWTHDLGRDLATLGRIKTKFPDLPPWSWEQTLRGLHYQAAGNRKFCRLVVVASDRSLPQLPEFVAHVTRYFPDWSIVLQTLVRRNDTYDLVDVRTVGNSDSLAGAGVPFEDFDEQATALRQALAQLRREGYRDRDVMIDITGGQKPTSAVAAAVTFNTDIRIQYVQTNPPWQVLGYDLIASQDGGSG